jgi:hypothetical protein
MNGSDHNTTSRYNDQLQLVSNDDNMLPSDITCPLQAIQIQSNGSNTVIKHADGLEQQQFSQHLVGNHERNTSSDMFSPSLQQHFFLDNYVDLRTNHLTTDLSPSRASDTTSFCTNNVYPSAAATAVDIPHQPQQPVSCCSQYSSPFSIKTNSTPNRLMMMPLPGQHQNHYHDCNRIVSVGSVVKNDDDSCFTKVSSSTISTSPSTADIASVSNDHLDQVYYASQQACQRLTSNNECVNMNIRNSHSGLHPISPASTTRKAINLHNRLVEVDDQPFVVDAISLDDWDRSAHLVDTPLFTKQMNVIDWTASPPVKKISNKDTTLETPPSLKDKIKSLSTGTSNVQQPSIKLSLRRHRMRKTL